MLPRSDRPGQAKLRCKHHRRYQGCFTPLASLARSCRIAVGLLFALVPLSAILFVLSILVASVGPVLRAQLSGEETIVRVFFDDLPTGRLIAASLEPIESKYENGYLVVEVTAEQLQRLQQRGLRTEPVSAQELSTILAPPREIQSAQAPEQAAAATRTGISGFSCYRTVEETFAAADSIVAHNPTLASWVDVGDSWLKTDGQGGYDMRVLVLTNQNVSGTKPKLFVTSAIHAREYTTAELTTRFAESLVNEYGVAADATWLLDHHEVHLMLQANPDGRKHAEAGQLWRKNVNENYCTGVPLRRGADLNRNFDFAWDCCGGSSDFQCSNTYHGAFAASEPEVLSIQNYIQSIFPDQRGPNLTDPAPDDATGIYLDIHSSGQLILYPYGFTERLAPNNTQLQTFARKLAFFNLHTPQQLIDLYITEGTAEDFGYGEMGLASFTYELGTEFFEDCSYFEETLLPRNMPSLYYAAKVARTPYMTPSGPDVVDGSLSLSAGEWPSVVAAGTSVTLSATLSDSQFNNSNGTEPTQSLETAEYYIDTPPWVTTPVPVPLSMVGRDGDVYEASLDTAGLSAGRHIVFVHGKDSDQNWGAFNAIFLGIGMPPPPPPPPPPPIPRPDAPRNLLVEGGDGQVTLTWDAPEDDGGSAITDYEYRINGRRSWTSIGSTQTTHTVTGLVNGTTYTFQVRAVNRNRKSRASNRAEATPRAAVALDFAHFANGTGITSDFVFVNVSPRLLQPALYFYDQGGHLIAPGSVVDITGDLETQEDGSLTVRTEMEPLAELTISTHGRGELVSGSVKVVSDGPIGGGLRYNLPAIGEAVVGASPPVGDALFPVRRQEGGINTGVAIHNLGEEAMEARCELMREGVLRDFVSISLEANGQTSWLIDQAFPAADTSDFTGSVRCAAPGRGRFTAIAVEIDAARRIFISVVPVDRTVGRGGETVLDFAHFVNGTWITDLVFVNLETQPSRPAPTPFHTAIPPSRPVIYFYDTEGALVAPESVVDVTGDLEITEDGALTVRTEMEPLGVLTISTHGRGELVSGSARVVSDGPIGGMLRFDHPDLGVAGVGASPPLSDALFPVRRQEGGINTGVALHNLESSPGLLRCDLMREGVLLDSASIPLEANGQTSWFIDQAFPVADTSDFAGSVRCDAVGEGLFSAVALEMDPGTRIFTTLPVVPVPEMPSQE